MRRLARMNIPPVRIIDRRDGSNRPVVFTPAGDDTKETTRSPVSFGDEQLQDVLKSLDDNDECEDA